MIVFYIFISVLIFSFLIFIHEFGHFIAAKLSGVRVNEFAINMGPKLCGFKRGETQYSLRLFPIGGYCAMEGEDQDTDDPRSFLKAAWWKRLIILCAGSFMNLLTGFVILLVLFAFFIRLPASAEISGFMKGNVVESQGLRVGDTLYALNGERIYQMGDFDILSQRCTSKICDLTVLRDGKLVELKNFNLTKTTLTTEDGQTGEYLGIHFKTNQEKTLSSVFRHAASQCADLSRWVWYSLGELVRGNVAMDELGGPAKLLQTMTESGVEAETVQDGMSNVFYLGAFIAVNLAVMNMLPIPALDGGRVFFLLINTIFTAITKKKINPKYEGWLHGGGLILLLVLMAFLFVKDLWQIIAG